MRLPLPNPAEIQDFQDLYERQFGVVLPYPEAAAMLTHMVQFYFLTKGHELHEHNERVRAQQRQQKKKRARGRP